MNSGNVNQQDSSERIFSKATRTFPVQMDAIKRYRGSGEQSVTVQNVSVHDGGQAIVGNVAQQARGIAPNKVSPPALTDGRMQPMEIIGEHAKEPLASIPTPDIDK